ncbi:MAG TPA: cyclic nucleotide-binding domain-containing protein, partial [Gaiellaceae bacterium]
MAAARGDFKIEPLLPFMKHERRVDGDVLFKTGDRGDRMYFLQRGRVRLREIDKVLKDGDVFGEIGLLSADKERTATAVCEGECSLYGVTQDVVMQLFYQKPEFSFFLVRLVTKRLVGNLAEAADAALEERAPEAEAEAEAAAEPEPEEEAVAEAPVEEAEAPAELPTAEAETAEPEASEDVPEADVPEAGETPPRQAAEEPEDVE